MVKFFDGKPTAGLVSYMQELNPQLRDHRKRPVHICWRILGWVAVAGLAFLSLALNR